MKYILKIFSRVWKKFQNVKFHFFIPWVWTGKNLFQAGKEKVPICKGEKFTILELFPRESLHFGTFPWEKFTFWNFSLGKVYILEFFSFPVWENFTFWNFSPGKSLHFGIFLLGKFYILEFFSWENFTFWNFFLFQSGKILHFGTKVPKCKFFFFSK